MKILINASNLRTGGALQVANSFLLELVNYTTHSFVVVVSEEVDNFLSFKVDSSHNVIKIVYSNKPTLVKALFGINYYLSRIERNHLPDKVFTIFGPSYWRPKAFHICGFAKPDYIFKESPYFLRLTFKEKVLLFLKEAVHLVDIKKNADIYVSENLEVSRRLSKRINKPVATVSNTYNQVFDNKGIWQKVNLNLREDSFKCLTISVPYKHKNLEAILSLADYINNNQIELKVDFILTVDQKEFPEAVYSGSENCVVHFIGRKNIREVPSLYQEVDAMLLPTLLECFSASYCEAMYMRRLILTSQLSFAEATCGKGAIYFDPTSSRSILESLKKAVNLSEVERDCLLDIAQARLDLFLNPKQRAAEYIKLITNER